MIGRVLEFDDLKQLLNCRRLADVEARLQKQQIKYFYGRGGVWTTLDALNAALGVATAPEPDGAYNPESVL